MRAYGVDALDQKNAILVLGRSVPRSDIPVPSAMSARRMEIRQAQALIEPLGKGLSRLKGIINIDVKMALPQNLIDFILRKVAFVAVLGMFAQARSAVKSPLESPHALRMRTRHEFYER